MSERYLGKLTGIDARYVILIAVLTFLVRLALAVLFPNIYWPDEIFQSVEQAHRLAFGYGIIPWEFRDGTRSWLLPGLLTPWVWLGGMLAGGKGVYVASEVFLIIVSLGPVITCYCWVRQTGSARSALIATLLMSLWFDLVFFASKGFAEVVAAHVLVPGIYLGLFTNNSFRRALAAGVLIGLALVIRVHLVPAVGLCSIWIIWLLRGSGLWRPFVVGAAAIVVFAGGLDWVTWGLPFYSYWSTFYTNVIVGKSAKWGVGPAHFYAETMWNLGHLAAPGLIVLACYHWRRHLLLLVTAAAVLLSHQMIGHKEYRFIYPFILLIVLIAALTTGFLLEHWKKRTGLIRGLVRGLLVLFWLAGSVVVLTRFDVVATGSRAGAHFGEHHLVRLGGGVKAFHALSHTPDVCGVGLIQLDWFNTTGYSGLNRDIPLYEFKQADDLLKNIDAVNTLVGMGKLPLQIGPFVRQKCYDKTVCIYARPGGCTPQTGYHFNIVIGARGE